MYSLYAAATFFGGYIAYKTLRLDEVVKFSYNYVIYTINNSKVDQLATQEYSHVEKVKVLTYTHNGSTYKMLVNKRRIPSDILTITWDGGEGEDITWYVSQFLGPNEDFHSIDITPKMLGIDGRMTITFLEKDDRVFGVDEVISVKDATEESQPSSQSYLSSLIYGVPPQPISSNRDNDISDGSYTSDGSSSDTS
jgi:hypothetical protein